MNRLRIASLIIPLAIGGSACSDRTPVGPDTSDKDTGSPLPMGMVVSNPHSSSTNANAAAGLASVSVSAESTVYVSLPPKTLTNALYVRIRNRTADGARPLVPIIDGGFDPVPIQARTGDVLDLTISAAGGGTIAMTVTVPARRPPAVVRSDPPKGRTDVALNVTVTVVFSEPINPKTLDATSVRLLHDGNAVSGTVRLSGNSWVADFVPDKPLEPQSNYELVVTQEIRDLDGDSLTAPQSITFTTGVLASQVLLTGFYSGSVTGTLAEVNGVPLRTITLHLEHSGSRLSGTWVVDGSPFGPLPVDPGVFSSTSSESNFGTVNLFLRLSQIFFAFELVADVTKADGSELSGVLYNLDTEGAGFEPPFVGMPIVLKRFSK